MSTSQIKIGQAGEQIAVQFLSQNGYTVVERNWRHEHQEIDIIAKDDHFLVFVEVKTRSCLSPALLPYGRPARAVHQTKQKNVLLAAKAYLRAHPELKLQPRLDVIEIYVRSTLHTDRPPTLLKINHIRNAFGAH